MTLLITTKNADEIRPHEFVTEASDVGLRPGQWPETLETNLGNRLPFVRRRPVLTSAGEVGSVFYFQRFGCVRLQIFNS